MPEQNGQAHHRVYRLPKAVFRFCALVLLLTMSMAAGADEQAIRDALKAQSRTLIAEGDMAAIDRIASGYRSTRERTPAGIWKLSLFYNGIDSASPDDPNSAGWISLEHSAAQWLSTHPQSPTAVVITAKLLFDHAWRYRGQGYSSEISDDNRQPLSEYLERTRDLLEKYREIGSTDPEWFVIRLGVAKLLNDDKSSIIDTAADALVSEPYYYPIHYAAVSALLPKWGGSERLVKRYIGIAAEHASSQEGDQAYGRIYFNIARAAGGSRGELSSAGVDWPRLKSSLDEITRAYPDPWNVNTERAMACLLGAPSDYRQVAGPNAGPRFPVADFDTPKLQSDCDDWGFRGKSFSQPTRAAALAFVPVIGRLDTPFAIGVLVLLGFFIAVVFERLLPQAAPLAPVQAGNRFTVSASDEPLFPMRPRSIDASRYPRTYWMSSGWQFFFLVVGSALIVAGILALTYCLGAATFRTAADTAVFSGLGVLAVALGFYLSIYARLSRVVLEADSVERRNVFKTYRLNRSEIAGRRALRTRNAPPTTFLVPKSGGGLKTIRLEGTYKIDDAYRDWLAEIPNIDLEEFKQSEAQILADNELGGTLDDRKARLDRARIIAKAVNIIASVLSLWAYVFPRPYMLVIALLAFLPAIAVALSASSSRLYQLDKRRGNARASLAAAFYAPGLVLAARAFFDVNLLDCKLVLIVTVILACLATALVAVVNRRNAATRWTYLGVWFVAAVYVYGGTVEADRLLDSSPPQVFRASVVGKHISSGKHTSWELKLGPWGSRTSAEDVHVQAAFYRSLNVGDTVCVDLEAGALGISWFYLSRC